MRPANERRCYNVFKHDGGCFIVVETPCFDKNLPASTENLPLEILAVEHTPYTKYLGPK